MDNLGLVLWNYAKFRYLYRFRSRNRLEAWQNKKIKDFLPEIIAQSDFYRSYYRGLSMEDWQDFPMIDKEIMMDNFDRLNTRGITKKEAYRVALAAERSRDFSPCIGEITVGLSSGTSGNRGLFLVSPLERAVWAGAMLAKTLPAGILAAERIAFFLRANSNLYQTIDSSRIRFRFFDLQSGLDWHIRELNVFQPTILAAPPSALRLLAEAKEAGVLNIAPQKVISVAEVLEILDQEYIAAQFGRTVHQIYQCTEGFLAVTCSHGTLHLNEDIVYIQKEYIDGAARRFIPVITDFSRTTQPIIRYRLNDILQEKSHCPCGSPFTALASVEGRTDDIFYLRANNGAGFVPVFPDFIRREIMAASDAIREYKADQISPDLMEIFLNFKPHAAEELIKTRIRQNFGKLCKEMNCVLPRINFPQAASRDERKKLRRVERKFSGDFAEG